MPDGLRMTPGEAHSMRTGGGEIRLPFFVRNCRAAWRDIAVSSRLKSTGFVEQESGVARRSPALRGGVDLSLSGSRCHFTTSMRQAGCPASTE